MTVLLLAAAAARGAAQEVPPPPGSPPQELKKLSLEELLQVEVTSVAKHPQPVGSVAAAVSVITNQDIRRSGVRTLADALRLATGVEVARFDSRTWAVSARGFNLTTANKMLVLIDGRTVYTPLFSGVFWDAQAPMLADVNRIEVIRGPGATLWGANAVNGVINVITKPAAETRGGLAVAGAGSEERGFGAVRWGGDLTHGSYRVYGKADYHDALVSAEGDSTHDPLHIGQSGFRADLDAAGGELTIQGDAYRGVIGHPVRDDTDVDGADLLAHWSRTLAGGSELSVRTYYDHTYRRVPEQFEEGRDTWDLEVQHRWRRGRHDLLWGGGYRTSRDHVVDSAVLAWDPDRATIWVVNGFVQDEVRLTPRWLLIAGTKLEDQSTMDLEVLPRLRLSFAPDDRQLVWIGASRAVRAPTRLDRDSRFLSGPVAVLVGSDDFRPEEVIAYELGYRIASSRHWFADLATFYNVYDDLRSLEPTPPAGLPLVIDNQLEATTRGVELTTGWQPMDRLELRAGASWLDEDFRLDPASRDPGGGTGEGNDPEVQSFLRADVRLSPRLELDAWLRQVGSLPDPRVPRYVELDLRLGWQASERLLLSLVGRNLLDDHHPEIGAPGQREEVQRGVYGEATWSF